MKVPARLRTSALIAIPAVVLLAAGTLFITGQHKHEFGRAGGALPVVVAKLPTTPMSVLGVYAKGSPQTYAPVIQFGYAVGRQPDVALYYAGWRADFNLPFAQAAWSHRATTFVQIDAPGSDLPGIADGRYDEWLRAYAGQVRRFGHPVMLSYEPEANGPWYTWGWKHQKPTAFIAAWRHIVTVFRSAGADNVTWIWTVNRISGTARSPRPWFPGDKYVTWIGIDGYIRTSSQDFGSVFQPTIDAVRQFTSKPIFLSETSVSPTADRLQKLPGLFSGIKYNNLLGMVWFDAAQNSGRGEDWSVEDAPASVVTEFRQEVTYIYK